MASCHRNNVARMARDYKNSIRNEQQEIVKMLNKMEGVNIKNIEDTKKPSYF